MLGWLLPVALAAPVPQLEALGYVGATEPAPAVSGVTVATPAAGDGVTLVSSGHAPWAALIGMDGAVLHRWQRPFLDSFPEHGHLTDHAAAGSWRHVTVLPDGGLLAIHEGVGLVRLGRDSRVVWAVAIRAHHDLVVTGDEAWVLTRTPHPRGGGYPVLEDAVSRVDLATGEVRQQVSVLEAVARSDHPAWADPPPPDTSGDVLHTNSLEVLSAEHAALHPAWDEGDLLIGSRVHGFVAVLAPDTGALVWSTTGPWTKQHDARLGPDGTLLLFDNQGLGLSASRVLAREPVGDRVVWSWGPDVGLHSVVLGGVQPLPDGQVLVTEGAAGRLWQVAVGSDEVVWSYTNPARVGDRIGALMTGHRLSWSEVPWLARPR